MNINNDENFRHDNWVQLNPDERLQAYQNDENTLAEEQRRTARTVTTPDRALESGEISQEYHDELQKRGGSGYDDENHPDKIYISDDYINDSKPYQRENEGNSPSKENQFQGRSAVAHEGRHATIADSKRDPEVAEKNGFTERQLSEFERGSEEASSLDAGDTNNSEKYRNTSEESECNAFASDKVFGAKQDEVFADERQRTGLDMDYNEGRNQEVARFPSGSKHEIINEKGNNPIREGNRIQNKDQTTQSGSNPLQECKDIRKEGQTAPVESAGKGQTGSIAESQNQEIN